MSIIFATRRGFLYQDRFAVLLYLQQLQAKKISEFYIDFPVPPRKSLDIRLLDIEKNEHIYEVKSGEEFKKDKKKKESSEVRDAFINLKEYAGTNQSAQLHLIIRKGFRGSITAYLDRLTNVKSHSFSQQSTKQSASWLHSKLRLPGISSASGMYDFCQKVDLTDSADDECNNENDPFPEIDDTVRVAIDDLSNALGFSSAHSEYPADMLMFQLYHDCQLLAGTGKNINDIFKKAITDFFVQRKALDERYTRNASGQRDTSVIRSDVVAKLDGYLGLTAQPGLPLTNLAKIEN